MSTRLHVCAQPKPLKAILLGECTVVCDGFAACTASAPVLELSRLMIARGVDPKTPLRVYRGKTLAIRVRAIGVAAGLRVAPHGSGFSRLSGRTTAPPSDLTRETHPIPTPSLEIDGRAS